MAAGEFLIARHHALNWNKYLILLIPPRLHVGLLHVSLEWISFAMYRNKNQVNGPFPSISTRSGFSAGSKKLDLSKVKCSFAGDLSAPLLQIISSCQTQSQRWWKSKKDHKLLYLPAHHFFIHRSFWKRKRSFSWGLTSEFVLSFRCILEGRGKAVYKQLEGFQECKVQWGPYFHNEPAWERQSSCGFRTNSILYVPMHTLLSARPCVTFLRLSTLISALHFLC